MDDEYVHNLERRLTELEEMLTRCYYQLGKGICELVDKKQADIDNIVNEIILLRKQLNL